MFIIHYCYDSATMGFGIHVFFFFSFFHIYFLGIFFSIIYFLSYLPHIHESLQESELLVGVKLLVGAIDPN